MTVLGYEKEYWTGTQGSTVSVVCLLLNKCVPLHKPFNSLSSSDRWTGIIDPCQPERFMILVLLYLTCKM